ncbi:CRISPR-associated helicase/endonuclease Cas3 [Psychrobacter phenylpyruvicus]|uniref:CRISPR-associated helicase Cas3 n=1 Tax=Psychrobacter phenylpyruvicus TaxID=29432 RepID=A0A379LIY9_9GAMM|nr:CRISPR-associated helicase/endonuclease Cas3 [Psychrobacter phenylpyruvicus]SUD90576.1 CRISPR-associated helicase Cas3 [Psychrobacter phenylpyruvicus]
MMPKADCDFEQQDSKSFIAHVRQGDDGQWLIHDLYEHCEQVGKLADKFAGDLGGGFAKIQGLYHDIGKYRQPFQERIRISSGYGFDEEAHLEQKAGKASHSHAGAMLMYQAHPLGVALAYTIAGHHTGLPDWTNNTAKCLSTRLTNDNSKLELEQTLHNLPITFKNIPDLQTLLPDFILKGQIRFETWHIWIRYLFSCLVDADFLDTEYFMSPDKQLLRGNYPNLKQLQKKFSSYMQSLQDTAEDTYVNKIRCDIYDQCIKAGKVENSIFTLTVPTGGGKTLSSMGFALEHALNFNKKRIIYAIPFTTIIEQNAQVFKKIFEQSDSDNGSKEVLKQSNFCVIEHHSNLDQPLSEESSKNRLASENWDAPIIVTTNVQLFESLFASRTSQCRKIHNIANSVIVLDEAQKIPRDFQKPITDMMRELSKNYGVTWLLCTATQPKLDRHTDAFGHTLFEGLPQPYRIISDEEALAESLKRVDIHFPIQNERWTWKQTAEHIVGQNSQCVLAIVNTRRDANELYQHLYDLKPNALIIHLSASMCPMHRELMIMFINQVLNKYHKNEMDLPFYVVSTQLIEAGVDVDFPIVYRAMTGLDSIAQSAGRCNREGKMSGIGQVIIFQPEKDAPAGELLQAQTSTYEILEDIKDTPLSPLAFYKYFSLFNSKGNSDKHNISELLTAKKESGTPLAISFRTASEKFNLINNNGVTVICPFYHAIMSHTQDQKTKNQLIEQIINQFPEQQWLTEIEKLSFCKEEQLPVEQLLTLLEQDDANRWVYRKLQRYSVTIPRYLLEQNSDMFKLKAGMYIAKDYNFLTGIVCNYEPLTRDECVW